MRYGPRVLRDWTLCAGADGYLRQPAPPLHACLGRKRPAVVPLGTRVAANFVVPGHQLNRDGRVRAGLDQILVVCTVSVDAMPCLDLCFLLLDSCFPSCWSRSRHSDTTRTPLASFVHILRHIFTLFRTAHVWSTIFFA